MQRLSHACFGVFTMLERSKIFRLIASSLHQNRLKWISFLSKLFRNCYLVACHILFSHILFCSIHFLQYLVCLKGTHVLFKDNIKHTRKCLCKCCKASKAWIWHTKTRCCPHRRHESNHIVQSSFYQAQHINPITWDWNTNKMSPFFPIEFVCLLRAASTFHLLYLYYTVIVSI